MGIRPSTVHAHGGFAWHASCCFDVMTPFIPGGNVPIEDRIEHLARLVLVILLIVTLGWIGYPRAQSATPENARQNDAPLILIAKPGLRDEFFGASILIAKPIGDDRHVGFVINRPTIMTLGKLFPEHGASLKVPDPVYLGGPWNTEYIFALVQSRTNPGGESLQIAEDLFLALDARTVDRVIERDASHARFFAGMVTWRPGELQEELKRGLWYVQESDSDLVMRKSTEGLWQELVTRSERRANAI
jgi:putative transcriptional regulator